MTGLMDRHTLKVDCTNISLKSDKAQNRGNQLVLYNVNIPAIIVYNSEELLLVLERIKNLILRDFEGEYVEFQITASLYLKHTETGQERIWTGTFFGKENSLDHI